MWKTGESPRGGAVFCPHPTVETFNSFHRACERNFCPDFFHRLSFHISQGLWRKIGVRMGGGFGVDFFEMKPCPHLGGVPPAAPFLSRQERGKECGLREALTGCLLPPQSRPPLRIPPGTLLQRNSRLSARAIVRVETF